jgi:hypothetical protein
VKVFVTEALIVTLADATPGTPAMTSPPIVADNPVAFDQLDVTDVELVFDIFIVCSMALLFSSDCSSTSASLSVLIVPRGISYSMLSTTNSTTGSE